MSSIVSAIPGVSKNGGAAAREEEDRRCPEMVVISQRLFFLMPTTSFSHCGEAVRNVDSCLRPVEDSQHHCRDI